MGRLIISILPLLFLTSVVSFAQSDNPDLIVGKWLVGSKTAHVEIFKRENKYFGKIIWLSEPNDAQGKPKVDSKNPEPALRSKPIVGLLLLRNFSYEGDKVWEDGKVYDPKSGKDYNCILTMKDNNTLDVRGYLGFSLIGQSETWTRVK